MRDLQKQYPELKITSQSVEVSESALSNHTKPGKYHVVIDPAAIARMGRDPEFAKRMHTNLAAIKTENDRADRKRRPPTPPPSPARTEVRPGGAPR